MSKFLKLLPWAVICTAFFIVGMSIRVNVPCDFDYELWGYDYGKYTFYFSNVNWITYMPFRHPLLGLISSPLVLVYNRMADASPMLYFVFLQLTFAIVGTLSVWLVNLVAGRIAAVIFMTFPFLWMAAAIPESYAISMCVLLMTLWWTIRQNSYPLSLKQKWLIWLILFIVASGVTLTNGIKVVIAYVISNDLSRRHIKRLLLFAAFMCATGVLFFACRMWYWNVTHPESEKTIMHALTATLRWSFLEMSITERLKAILYNFFLIPLTMGMKIAECWAFIIYVLSCMSIWACRKDCIVKVSLGMFSVDIIIHVFCGWALNEAWIFSPHWIWILPIFIAKGLDTFHKMKPSVSRRM